MTNEQIHDTIHRATMVAFEAGKKEGQRHALELVRKALDLNSTFNDIGRYIYLDDFEDGLRELNDQETRVS